MRKSLLRPSSGRLGMASIRAPYGTSQIRGSVGSKTFATNSSGLYIRERSVPVNPKSPAQNDIRSAMSNNSNTWVQGLLESQREGWRQYAQETPLPDGFGEPIDIGGRQHFLRTNNARVYAGLNIVGTAPPTPGVAEIPTFTLTGDTINGVELGILTPTLEVGDIVTIVLGNAVNQSVNFYASPYRFNTAILSVTAQPVLLIPDTAVVIGQRFFIEVRLLLNNGKVSFEERRSVDILT